MGMILSMVSSRRAIKVFLNQNKSIASWTEKFELFMIQLAQIEYQKVIYLSFIDKSISSFNLFW